MKKALILFLLSSLSTVGLAQSGESEADTLHLKEVVVKGSRVVNRADGIVVYPSAEQTSSSTSAYSLLRKLPLEGIRVDEVNNTISMNSMIGAVEVRVNGRKATPSELQSLDVASVKSVEYIKSPGVRYGEDVARVLDIKTRRSVGGVYVGAYAMSAVTAKNGRWGAFGKVNGGWGELSLDYSGGASRFDGTRITEEGVYQMADGSGVSVSRADRERVSQSNNHDLQLRYSLVTEGGNVFQTTLGTGFSRVPKYYNVYDVTKSTGTSYTVTNDDVQNNITPTLDFYGLLNLRKGQSLTLNGTFQYAKTDNESRMSVTSEPTYAYKLDGKAYDFSGEALYENKLKPFTLTAGLRYNQNRVDNGYSGDVASTSVMNGSDAYAFVQVQGRFRALSYILGGGVGLQTVRSDDERSNDWTFRPQLTLSYNITDKLKASYDFKYSPYVSRMQFVSNVAVRTNDMELTEGNPSLRPYGRAEHQLTFSYTGKRLYSDIMGLYRGNHDCVLQAIYRNSDDKFVFTRKNQGDCNMFFLMNYNSFDVIPDNLSVYGTVGLYRMYNYGDAYKHHYTSCDASLGVNAYVGRWTFQASFYSGFRNLEGETVNRAGTDTFLSVQYRMGQFTAMAYWQGCFQGNVKTNEAEVLNRFVHKTITRRSSDLGNLVGLKLSWNFSKGRKYADIKRRYNRGRIDTGVMNGN